MTATVTPATLPLAVSCKDVPGGAEPADRTGDAAPAAAVHSWFDAHRL
jgi:hypothetical protein